MARRLMALQSKCAPFGFCGVSPTTSIWSSVFACSVRPQSTSTSTFVAPLRDRALVKITGKETVPLLQALVTNDLSHLRSERCMYALLLDVRGRVQFDLILHQLPPGNADADGALLVDLHADQVQQFTKTLRMLENCKQPTRPIKMSKQIPAVGWYFDLWQLSKAASICTLKLDTPLRAAGHTRVSAGRYGLRKQFKATVCDDYACVAVFIDETVAADLAAPDLSHTVVSALDPRLKLLGYRTVVADGSKNALKLSEAIGGRLVDGVHYRRHRFTLGVAEGQLEMPAGQALPLNFNADYMNGVSFHKGCYLGQELTARTHHTGVVRKRLVPIRLPSANGADLFRAGSVEYGARLRGAQKPHRTVGRVVSLVDFDDCVLGLALCDVDTVRRQPDLMLDDTKPKVLFRAVVPRWWPETKITGRVTGFQPRDDS